MIRNSHHNQILPKPDSFHIFHLLEEIEDALARKYMQIKLFCYLHDG